MDNLFENFLSEYGTAILYAILTGLAAIAGKIVKAKYEEWANTKTKKDVVKTVVFAMEQLYKDLNGPERKEKAIESIVEMLAEKNISISELEINMLIEATIAEAKNAFNKPIENNNLDVEAELKALDAIEDTEFHEEDFECMDCLIPAA